MNGKYEHLKYLAVFSLAPRAIEADILTAGIFEVHYLVLVFTLKIERLLLCPPSQAQQSFINIKSQGN